MHKFISNKDIPDGVASPHPDPLGDWPVLLKLLGQLGLDAEGLVRTLEEIRRVKSRS